MLCYYSSTTVGWLRVHTVYTRYVHDGGCRRYLLRFKIEKASELPPHTYPVPISGECCETEAAPCVGRGVKQHFPRPLYPHREVCTVISINPLDLTIDEWMWSGNSERRGSHMCQVYQVLHLGRVSFRNRYCLRMYYTY